MRKYLPLLFGTLLLAACNKPVAVDSGSNTSSPAQATSAAAVAASSIQWTTFHNANFGISLPRPTDYIVQETMTETINANNKTFEAEFIYMRESELGGESPFLEVLRTKDPLVLNGYLNADNPLVDVSIGGTAWQKFHWEGMGDPFGYVIKKGDWYIVVSFTGWDESFAEANVMTKVMFD